MEIPQLQEIAGKVDVYKRQHIIVATDAGREGELIFRYLYHYTGCTTPFVRLWISSLDVYKRQHQSRPQVGRAERLRGVPLHAA